LPPTALTEVAELLVLALLLQGLVEAAQLVELLLLKVELLLLLKPLAHVRR